MLLCLFVDGNDIIIKLQYQINVIVIIIIIVFILIIFNNNTSISIIFIESLLYSIFYKYFVCIISFNPHNHLS